MKEIAFYRALEKFAPKLYLRGEAIPITYEVFYSWLNQNEKSLEELLITKRNEIGYFTNEGVEGILEIAHSWIAGNRQYKTHKTLVRAKYRIYNSQHQWLVSY